MTVDYYATSGRRWAAGATLVYGPIAGELVECCPYALDGRSVLDAGAGTGVASVALAGRGAHPVAVDFSYDMLAWNAAARAPAAVADICALPIETAAFDGSVAAFVLNHLATPAAGFAELVRVTKPGGFVVACVFSNDSRSEVRDNVDAVARAAGWEVPPWYVQIKSSAAPLLGSTADMSACARDSGLVDIVVDEHPVDVGITRPEELVDYRFGQAQFASWLDGIGEAQGALIKRRAVDAIRPIMRPYRPIVVFLSARTLGSATGTDAR